MCISSNFNFNFTSKNFFTTEINFRGQGITDLFLRPYYLCNTNNASTAVIRYIQRGMSLKSVIYSLYHIEETHTFQNECSCMMSKA